MLPPPASTGGSSSGWVGSRSGSSSAAATVTPAATATADVTLGATATAFHQAANACSFERGHSCGKLLPANVSMVERIRWLSKRVDVYDADQTHLGYFFDMHFLFFLRFGFSDANDRIWFEARYPNFWSRFKWSIEYEVARCDERGGTFEVIEDYWARPWFCWTSCRRVFHVRRAGRNDASWSDATAVFDSRLTWVRLGLRHVWYMDLSRDVASRARIAHAHQSFPNAWLLRSFSHWALEIEDETTGIPNWLTGFLTALEDLQVKKDD